MTNTRRMGLSIATALLTAICAIGLVAAGQQYFVLRFVDDALESQEALDDSFAVAVRAGTVGSSRNEFVKALGVHLQQTADVRQAVSKLGATMEKLTLISAALWVAALAVIAVAFFWKRSERPDLRNDAAGRR